ALEGHLIELRGVAGDVVDVREHHAPGDGGRASPEFTIDEISPSPGGQTQGDHRRDEVAHLKKVTALSSGVPEQYENHAQQATMEGHAPLPYIEDLDGVGQVVPRLVDQGIAQAAPHHDTDHTIENDVFQLAQGEIGFPLPDASPAEQPHGGKAQQIHQSIPMNGDRAELQGDGVELWMLQHETQGGGNGNMVDNTLSQ